MLAAADVVRLEAEIGRATGRRVYIALTVDDGAPALACSMTDPTGETETQIWPLVMLGADVAAVVESVSQFIGVDRQYLAAPRRKEGSNHFADRRITWSPATRPYTVVDHMLVLPVMARRDKVLIYAAAQGTRLPACLEKLEDPSWEVWGLNLIAPIDREGRVRADIWWDIHQRKAQSADDLRWIAACPRPIFVPADLVDAGPNCVAFSFDAVLLDIAKRQPRYPQVDLDIPPCACTFAYQIAYALAIGAREIALYGVELSVGTRREQTVEWASVNWWLGFATACGVRIEVPPTSRLGRHQYLYGFEYAEEIDDVNAYLWSTEDGLRRQLKELDARRTAAAGIGGRKAEVLHGD